MSQPKYRAVIFDLDGTLLDTLDDLMEAINEALSQQGFPCRTREEVRTFVGNGLGMLVHRALPPVQREDEEISRQTLTALKTYYASHNNVFTRPYEGIQTMLRALKEKGLRLAIVSNKNDPNVKELTRVYFPDTIELAAGESPTVRRKPNPDMVRLVMETFGVTPEETLYVGDSEVDIQTAANAGIPCAIVTWGFRTRAELRAAGAGEMWDTPEQLTRMILGE